MNQFTVLKDYLTGIFLFLTCAYAALRSDFYATLTSFAAFYFFIEWRTYAYDMERSNEGSEREKEVDV